MVIMLIMDLLKALILFVISLFPTFPSTSFVSGFMPQFKTVIRSVNQFISVPMVGTCLLAIFLCYNARAIWSIIMWVVRKIPGVE